MGESGSHHRAKGLSELRSTYRQSISAHSQEQAALSPASELAQSFAPMLCTSSATQLLSALSCSLLLAACADGCLHQRRSSWHPMFHPVVRAAEPTNVQWFIVIGMMGLRLRSTNFTWLANQRAIP